MPEWCGPWCWNPAPPSLSTDGGKCIVDSLGDVIKVLILISFNIFLCLCLWRINVLIKLPYTKYCEFCDECKCGIYLLYTKIYTMIVVMWVYYQGRSHKFVLGGIKVFWGWIKLLNSRSDVILSHKKFTWADFFLGGGYKYRYPPPSLRPWYFQYNEKLTCDTGSVDRPGDVWFRSSEGVALNVNVVFVVHSEVARFLAVSPVRTRCQHTTTHNCIPRDVSIS